MGEAKTRARARLSAVGRAAYARGGAVLAYRRDAVPGMDAGTFLTLVEAEMRAPAALRHEAAGRSDGSLDSLLVHAPLDDGRWHLFTPAAGYASTRDDLPPGLVPDPSEPHRHYRLLGRPFELSGTRGDGLAGPDGAPWHPASLAGLVRLSEAGLPLCEADAPLSVQRVAAGADPGHGIHVDVLATWVESSARRDGLAAADRDGLADLRPHGHSGWAGRHGLRALACARWAEAAGPAAVGPFVRGVGAPSGEWTTDPEPGSGPAGRALAQAAAVGLRPGAGLRALVPGPEPLRVARDWLARACLVAREDGVLAGTASGVVAALVTPADGRPVLLAWPATPPPAGLSPPAGLDGPDPGLAALYAGPGRPVGMKAVRWFDDPEGFPNLAPALLLAAHREGCAIDGLADALVGQALSARSRWGALRAVLGGRAPRTPAHPHLALFARQAAWDPWSPRFPALLAADLAALDAARARGADLLDVAREAIFGPRAAEDRAA